MVKRILGIDSTKGKIPKNLKAYKKQYKQVKTKKQLERDTFEARYKSETQGLEFKVQRIQFSPEDEAKLKEMSIKDRIAYIRELKKEGKYKISNDTQ